MIFLSDNVNTSSPSDHAILWFETFVTFVIFCSSQPCSGWIWECCHFYAQCWLILDSDPPSRRGRLVGGYSAPFWGLRPPHTLTYTHIPSHTHTHTFTYTYPHIHIHNPTYPHLTPPPLISLMCNPWYNCIAHLHKSISENIPVKQGQLTKDGEIDNMWVNLASPLDLFPKINIQNCIYTENKSKCTPNLVLSARRRKQLFVAGIVTFG